MNESSLLIPEPFDEHSCDALLTLLKNSPPPEIYALVERWVEQFPEHPKVHQVVGALLELGPSTRAVDLAVACIQRAEKARNIWCIISAASKVIVGRNKLFAALTDKYQQDPHAVEWGSLQDLGVDCHDVNDFMLEWISRNSSNADIAASLCFVAAFTNSEEVLRAIFRWMEQVGHSSDFARLTIIDVLRGNNPAHQTVLPEALELARRWVRDYSDPQIMRT